MSKTNPHLTSLSNKLLQAIVVPSNDYKTSFNDLWSFLKMRSLPDIKKTSFKEIPYEYDIYENEYMTDMVVTKVHSIQDLQQTIIKYHMDSLSISLHIIHRANELLHKFVKTIIYIIQFIYSLSPPQNKDLTITYYLLDIPKQLPKQFIKNPQPLSKNNVNSGMCERHPYSSKITIWRKEEVVKVTIHELIHAFNYDSMNDSPELIQHYQQKYGITSTHINSFEAYTEIWAKICNCFLLSKQQNDFVKCLHTEKIFSDVQKEIILYSCSTNKDMNKHTNCLAYYVICNELLHNLPEFIQYCKVYNKHYIQSISSNKWNSFLQDIPQQKNKKVKSQQKSLKMCIYDYNVFS